MFFGHMLLPLWGKASLAISGLPDPSDRSFIKALQKLKLRWSLHRYGSLSSSVKVFRMWGRDVSSNGISCIIQALTLSDYCSLAA
ncbi:conserved hypothetical protein [Ricinus communis]|uniref:Uncharacterized protein n=1 Tax=Ricinus communis TaxID=3988 RepID=B9SWX1_RICCO|nr:conserved hypothetical protein [Ricinus communis]